jgi:hypothetical protein
MVSYVLLLFNKYFADIESLEEIPFSALNIGEYTSFSASPTSFCGDVTALVYYFPRPDLRIKFQKQSSSGPEAMDMSTRCRINGKRYIVPINRPNSSTCCQSVNSTTALGSVGPLVIHMIRRIIRRSKGP